MSRHIPHSLGLAVLFCGLSIPVLAQPVGESVDHNTQDNSIRANRLGWRDTTFVLDNYLSADTLDKNARLTYNPSFLQSYSLRPRWYFTRSLSLRLRQDLIVALTGPDSHGMYSSYSIQEKAFFLNTRVELIDSRLFEIEGVRFGVGGRLVLPVSISSRASRRILGAGVTPAISKSFNRVLKGLSLSAEGLYIHNFGLSNVTATQDDISCTPALSDFNNAHSTSPYCLGGASVVNDELAAGLQVELKPIAPLTLSIGLTWVWLHAASLRDAQVKTLTGDVVLSDSSRTHWRNLTQSHLTIGYLLDEWIELSTGIFTASTQIGPDGSLRNPIFNIDTQITLKATILLDRLYLRISG